MRDVYQNFTACTFMEISGLECNRSKIITKPANSGNSTQAIYLRHHRVL